MSSASTASIFGPQPRDDVHENSTTSGVALGLSRATGMAVNSQGDSSSLEGSMVILLGGFGGLYVLSDLSAGLQSSPQRRGIDHDGLGWW